MTKQLWFVVACVIAFVVLAADCKIAHALTQKQVFQIASSASVRIHNDGDDPGVGSGTIIATDKVSTTILTCAHVVSQTKNVTVVIDTEGADTPAHYKGVVIKRDESIDLALVKIAQPVGRAAVPIADAEPDLFDELMTVGNPATITRQAAHELLNTKDLVRHGHRLWTLSGEAIPGMSGAGVLDSEGKIVCVIHATWETDDQDYTQIVLAIPLATIKAFIK